MKNRLFTAFAAGVLAVFAAGCVHFEYDGDTAPETGSPVKIVRDQAKLAPFAVTRLGKAVAWGNYQDVSRDKLEEKLQNEAMERGANTVLVTADQVVPDGAAVRVDSMVKTMEAVSPNNANSMNQLQQDFNGGYGQAELFGKNKQPAHGSTGMVRDYTRIIRAEFLVVSPRKTPAPAAKRP